MRLRTQIVDFIGLDLVDQTIQVSGVRQVTVMQMQRSTSLVRIRIDVIETIGIEIGCATDDAMYLVASGEQKLGKIGSILPRYSGNESLRRELV